MITKSKLKRKRLQIRQWHKRRKKIKKLKEKLQQAQTLEEREKIIEKILKIAPHYPIENLTKEIK